MNEDGVKNVTVSRKFDDSKPRPSMSNWTELNVKSPPNLIKDIYTTVIKSVKWYSAT